VAVVAFFLTLRLDPATQKCAERIASDRVAATEADRDALAANVGS